MSWKRQMFLVLGLGAAILISNSAKLAQSGNKSQKPVPLTMEALRDSVQNSRLPDEHKKVLLQPTGRGEVISLSAYSDGRTMINYYGADHGWTWFWIDIKTPNSETMLKLAMLAAEKKLPLSVEEDPFKPHYVKSLSVSFP